MDAVRDYQTARMSATMTIVDRTGRETTMKLVSHEQTEGDKSLMRFTYPARLKGTAILTVGDSIWYYNRRTNRVRLLSRSAKQGSMMGSSFSYDDLNAEYAEDYAASLLEETKTSYTLKLVPKAGNKKYRHLIAQVAKDTYLTLSIEYYNQRDILYKRLVQDQFKKVDGHWVALKVSMTETASQKVTYFTTDETNLEFDLPIKNTLFSERNLKL